jgi:hypothetical protein
MADWLSSMQQTYEYYVVDPGTWRDVKLLDNVIKCTINRDSTVETLGSATFDVTDTVGECYIRSYLVTVQNGVRERHPLGTHLVQTPSSKFDGRVRSVSMDAYTPLLELKENQPPLGYYIPVSDAETVMDVAYRLTRDHVRAPVIKTTNPTVNSQDFIADSSDTWLSYLRAFMSNRVYNFGDNLSPTITSYEYTLDEMGRILFAPKQDTASLQPVWTYDDGNSSILHPEITMDHDIYGIPNVVEVIYHDDTTGDYYHARVENNDVNSPTSIVNRGREIIYRVEDPEIYGTPTNAQIDEYAAQLLEALSTIEYVITYTHGYCPVRIGDCVRLNYTRSGLTNIKARVISQTIECVPGCPVTEKAVFTKKLWR